MKPDITILALLLPLMMLINNAFADSQELADLESGNSQCRAIYALDEGTLSIPCVKVFKPTDEPQFYAAELQQIPDTEPPQFSVNQLLSASNLKNQADSCVATYLITSGEVYLPCVDMVEPSGEIESSELIFQTDFTNSVSSLQLFFDDTSLDETIRTRHTRGNNIPEATTGFIWPLFDYKFTNNGGYKFEQISSHGGNVYHPGEDWNVASSPGGPGNGDKGLDVVAVANGKVVYVNHNSWGGLVIQHHYKGETWYSQYGHVQNILVSENQIVTQKQKVAEIGNVSEYDDKMYAHLHFEIREADHPNPTYGPYWSQLTNLTNVRNWYEDPDIFIPAHPAYELLNLNSKIQITPSPLIQNAPVSVQVSIANTGGAYQGRISAAVYNTTSGQPINDIAPFQWITIEQNEVKSYTFDNQALSLSPGTYELKIEYDAGEENWKSIPEGYYTNPIPITVQSKNSSSSSSSSTSVSKLIDNFYYKYRGFFGTKRGSNYLSGSYTYQDFSTGKTIAVKKSGSSSYYDIYYFSGGKWTYYGKQRA